MFHKFFVGETEEEKRQRIKEEEAAAVAYKEWEKKQDEAYAVQTTIINMIFRFVIGFWIVMFRLLFKIIGMAANYISRCKKASPHSARASGGPAKKEG